MYVAIWVGTAPITPPDAIEAGEISLAGTTALRFDDPEHGPLATFSCDGQHVLVGILGVDDNVIGTDPLPRYAEAVATTAC